MNFDNIIGTVSESFKDYTIDFVLGILGFKYAEVRDQNNNVIFSTTSFSELIRFMYE